MDIEKLEALAKLATHPTTPPNEAHNAAMVVAREVAARGLARITREARTDQQEQSAWWAAVQERAQAYAREATTMPDGWRPITAKFASRCYECGNDIEAGAECWWKKGSRARCSEECCG